MVKWNQVILILDFVYSREKDKHDYYFWHHMYLHDFNAKYLQ